MLLFLPQTWGRLGGGWLKSIKITPPTNSPQAWGENLNTDFINFVRASK